MGTEKGVVQWGMVWKRFSIAVYVIGEVLELKVDKSITYTFKIRTIVSC